MFHQRPPIAPNARPKIHSSACNCSRCLRAGELFVERWERRVYRLAGLLACLASAGCVLVFGRALFLAIARAF